MLIDAAAGELCAWQSPFRPFRVSVLRVGKAGQGRGATRLEGPWCQLASMDRFSGRIYDLQPHILCIFHGKVHGFRAPRLERVAVPGQRLRVDLTSAILGTGELENIHPSIIIMLFFFCQICSVWAPLSIFFSTGGFDTGYTG